MGLRAALSVRSLRTEYAVPRDVMLIAAADHCLAAAYRGECPGVDPDALMRWRAESRAAFQRRPVEAVLADIAAATERLRAARGSDGIADLGNSTVPEAPEAACRAGIPFLAVVTERDGPPQSKCCKQHPPR